MNQESKLKKSEILYIFLNLNTKKIFYHIRKIEII